MISAPFPQLRDDPAVQFETIEPRALSPRSSEFVITQCPLPGEPVTAAFERLAAALGAGEAELLSLFVFGAVAARAEIESAMRGALGEAQWPITWVEGGPCHGNSSPLAGLQAFAISGRPVTRVRLGRRVVGSVYEDTGARHCLLGGLGPTSLALGPAAQTQQTLGNLEWALDCAGFALGDVVRTWFYNDDIVPWYGEFNRVRSAHYADVRWRTGSLPASTGIGARNVAGAALTVAAWAVRPLHLLARVREIASPLQCPAPAYGSSFSRAMEINTSSRRRLLISGTASIHPDGRTAWAGDAHRQIDLTMDVVAAILDSRGLGFSDVTRATAYFESPSFKPHFDTWCAAHGLRDMPVVGAHCDICRDDLLFEIELDACADGSGDDGRSPRSAQGSPSAA
jgi:enamine deaminase RidA (YjgF/YER057c/UK114 family)